MLYNPTIITAKLSLLALYLRILRSQRTLRYCIYITMVVLSLFYAAAFTAYGILAIPRPGQNLLQLMLSRNAVRETELGIVQGAINMTSDLCILVLPISTVLELQLPLRKKIGVLSVFMTGLLAFVAAAIGLSTRVHMSRTDDVTWKLVTVYMWNVIELTVGVVCGSLPAFAGFFRHHLPLLQSITSRFYNLGHSIRLPRNKHHSGELENVEQLIPQHPQYGLRDHEKGQAYSLFTAKYSSRGLKSSNNLYEGKSRNCNNTRATRRDYYECRESHQQVSVQHPTATYHRPNDTSALTALPPWPSFSSDAHPQQDSFTDSSNVEAASKHRWWRLD